MGTSRGDLRHGGVTSNEETGYRSTNIPREDHAAAGLESLMGIETVAASLVLRLFGPLTVWVKGEPLPRLRSRKGKWLLALLALRAGRQVERDWLAALLWPDSPP